MFSTMTMSVLLTVATKAGEAFASLKSATLFGLVVSTTWAVLHAPQDSLGEAMKALLTVPPQLAAGLILVIGGSAVAHVLGQLLHRPVKWSKFILAEGVGFVVRIILYGFVLFFAVVLANMARPLLDGGATAFILFAFCACVWIETSQALGQLFGGAQKFNLFLGRMGRMAKAAMAARRQDVAGVIDELVDKTED